MGNTILQSLKSIFQKKVQIMENTEDTMIVVNVSSMERYYTEGDLQRAAIILRSLLEEYAKRKKMKPHTKGREFIYFILSNKHKDLKSEGYTHWTHITKIVQMRNDKVYPYHERNLRLAMDFFKKEIKGITTFDYQIKKV